MTALKKINWKRQIFLFFATLFIFGSGFFLSNFLIEKKISQLTNLQQDLRLDILSFETQFSILAQIPCKSLDETTLTQELYDISQRLELVGSTLSKNNPQFQMLKKYYSILEIKHWLLLKKTVKDCNLNLVSIIYFYSDKSECPQCQDQGLILTYLRKKYAFLRVYSFDYDLPLSALQTLKSIYSLESNFPIIIVQEEVYYGFKTKDELEEILAKYIEPSEPREKEEPAKESLKKK